MSAKVIGPTEGRIRAEVDARQPENVHELRTSIELGLVNNSARFIPQYATVSDPLRRLTRKDMPFVFGSGQIAAFETLSEELAKAMKLSHFDIRAPTKVIADASPVGLGAVLIQEQSEGPVVVNYASRSLWNTERQYSQTEKEALGLVWACKKFHPLSLLESLEDIFSRQGWPLPIKSDNRPQFRSDEFGEYCEHYAI